MQDNINLKLLEQIRGLKGQMKQKKYTKTASFQCARNNQLKYTEKKQFYFQRNQNYKI